MASQLLGIKTRFTNDLGSPLVGGQVYTYFAGTSTNQDSYSDAALTVPNTNPVILDDTGSADIFLKGSYRIRVFDKSGRFIEEQDNVTQAASQGDATEINQRIADVQSDIDKVKLDTGITITSQLPGQVERSLADQNTDTVSVLIFGKIGVDSSELLQKAANFGGTILVPAGIYNIDSVTITKNVVFNCAEGVVFKRKAQADVLTSAWDAGTAMFEVREQGLKLSFHGNPVFDGNNMNQPNELSEPLGYAIKVQSPSSPAASTTPTELYVQNAKFINGTSGYIAIRGDNNQRRYLTRVVLDNCSMHDTLYGLGKGEVGVNPIGYHPQYMLVVNHVHLITNNITAEFLKPIRSAKDYAPVLIVGTFAGSSHATSGECCVWMYGTTTITGMGRHHNGIDGSFNTNNAIGVVDIYGNGELFYCENLYAKDCKFSVLRAKASIKHFTVDTVVVENCVRTLLIGNSTTGATEVTVNLGDITCYGGAIPQIEIDGTNSAEKAPNVNIKSFTQRGVTTNPDGLASKQYGVVAFKFCKVVNIGNIDIGSSVLSGVSIQYSERVSISNANIRNTTGDAINHDGSGDLTLINPTVSSINGAMLNVLGSSTTRTLTTIVGGSSDGMVNYCVVNQATSNDVIVTGHKVANVSGNSRGFHTTSGARMVVSNCVADDGVSEKINYASGGLYSENNNSWNSNIRYGYFTMTTQGTNKRGDIVYNMSPSAGGNLGWVCTASGTPGTWKTFGTVGT